MKIWLFVSLLFFSSFCFAQNKGNSGTILTVNLNYGYQLPSGELANRFGATNGLGGGLDYITTKNWIGGINGSWLFGTQVNEDVLANLRNENGALIGNNGSVASVFLRMRGVYGTAFIGKLIPFSKTNKRSGFRITVGGGFLQHRIRIQDDPEIPVASLRDGYKQGYDRLTNGFSVNQFVGYQYFAKNRRINFYAGLESTQGFTTNVRGYNFDTRSFDTDTRLDILYGFRFGWVLPFYLGGSTEQVWY